MTLAAMPLNRLVLSFPVICVLTELFSSEIKLRQSDSSQFLKIVELENQKIAQVQCHF